MGRAEPGAERPLQVSPFSCGPREARTALGPDIPTPEAMGGAAWKEGRLTGLLTLIPAWAWVYLGTLMMVL